MQRSGNPLGYRSSSSRLYAGTNKIYFLETAAFSLEPAVSLTLWPAAIWMVSPVCGLRPVRAARSVRSTASQPGMVIFSPAATEDSKTSNSASSTELTAAWLVPALPATSATSSLRFLAIDVLLDDSDSGACTRHAHKPLSENLPAWGLSVRKFRVFPRLLEDNHRFRRHISPLENARLLVAGFRGT